MKLRVQHADSAFTPNDLKALRKRTWKALVPEAAERKAAERALCNPEVELHPLLRAIVLIKHMQAAIAAKAKAKHAVRKRRALLRAIVHDLGACLCGCSDHSWSEPWAVAGGSQPTVGGNRLWPNPKPAAVPRAFSQTVMAASPACVRWRASAVSRRDA